MDTLLSPRRRQVLQALGAAALVAGCGDTTSRAGGAPAATRFGGETMGSTWSAKLAGPGISPETAAAARQRIEAAFADVVAKMSTYDDASELSRFNRHASRAPFTLSDDTFAVFARARDVSAAFGGAFDITVAPAVDAWGFGPAKAQRIVTGDQLRALQARVGWERLTLDPHARTVTKALPDVRADLSGIAKGYGVDRAAEAVEALGIADYMIEAGGEVRTRGRNAGGRPWQIAVERPDAVPQRAHRIVPLSGLAMATSGDYRIYFEQDGRRYCHEIDPATGGPIAPGLASVTVVAPECAYADAMATALIVLGPERGYGLAVARDVAALFIVREAPGRFRDIATPAFAALGGSPVAG